MKISVEKSKLENELRLFQGIFEKKAIMEILQNIKLSALANGVLEMVATDLEIGLTVNLVVDVAESGSVTVNGKEFCELISRMPNGPIDISEDNDLQILVSNPKKTSKYKLPGLQATDYPELPVSDFSNKLKLSLDSFQSMIDKSYYVVSPELKFNLGGSLLSISPERMEMAATDGHRLAFTSVNHTTEVPEQVEYIVSRKTLVEILKIGTDGELDFAFDNNNLFFRHNNRILSSRIIDQKFPNYKAVIPEKTEFKAVVSSESLMQTLKRILIFKTRNNGVMFCFSPGKLILERTTPEKGEGYDEIAIEYTGKPINIGFNGYFIIDFLSHINSDKIVIGMNDQDSAFLFKPHTEQKISFAYVVMPLNL
jgi:DNA polymerase III subunit beta